MARVPSVLVVESNRVVASTLRKHLEAAGCTVSGCDRGEDLRERLRQAPSPDLVLIGTEGLDGESLCRQVKALVPSTPVALTYPPDDAAHDQRAAAAGADGCIVGPLKRGNVVTCVRGLLRIRELTEQLAQLEHAMERRAAGKPAPSADASAELGFDFFKKLLLLEVKRSRRYRYPVSFMLISVDRLREVAAPLSQRDRAATVGRLLAAACKAVRDVDLCVLYAEDKFLTFLPHTDYHGAMIAAGRVRERLATFEWSGPRLTFSIGVSAYDGRGEVSFGALLKEASDALKCAQASGGDQIVGGSAPKPRDRVSIG